MLLMMRSIYSNRWQTFLMICLWLTRHPHLRRLFPCLKNNTYDVAILDIMGVRGYDLLEVTHALGITTLMLTAHALSPDNLKKSIELGADAYIPKDKMVDISLYVEDILISRQNKRKNNFKLYAGLMPLFDKFFGEGWKGPEKNSGTSLIKNTSNSEKTKFLCSQFNFSAVDMYPMWLLHL